MAVHLATPDLGKKPGFPPVKKLVVPIYALLVGVIIAEHNPGGWHVGDVELGFLLAILIWVGACIYTTWCRSKRAADIKESANMKADPDADSLLIEPIATEQFKISQDEYIPEVTRLLRKENNRSFGLIIALLAVCIFAIPGGGPVFVIATVASVYLYAVTIFLYPRQYFRNLNELSWFRYQLSTKSVDVETAAGKGSIAWDSFERCFQLKEMYIFVRRTQSSRAIEDPGPSKISWAAIPKRAFKNEDDEALFFKLVQEKLPTSDHSSADYQF